MGLLNIFKTDHDGIRRSHVKNLISVAMADGHLDHGEWELLLSICKVMEITEEEIQEIKRTPESVKFVPPKKYEDKVQQIQDLVSIMTIDGEINAKELELCKKISLKLDILPQMVDKILSDMFPDDLKKNVPLN
jgi:uncharacterized tellurite resistance protein B-like protein